MAVRVRLFAAVREAAGTGEVEVGAADLDEVLRVLRERFGEPFASRMEVCTVLVDGTAVGRTDRTPLADGAEVVLLPPVSGGSAHR
jgi:molybdopterin synthase sulfur carrier subunit